MSLSQLNLKSQAAEFEIASSAMTHYLNTMNIWLTHHTNTAWHLWEGVKFKKSRQAFLKSICDHPTINDPLKM